MIHYSTDYVFDGKKSAPYTENDKPSPKTVYGKSKFKGELALKAHSNRHTIFRTSWVYGLVGNNFANTILSLAMRRQRIEVVADQFGVPTNTDFICKATLSWLEKLSCNTDHYNRRELFNLVPDGGTSWYDFAKYLMEGLRSQGVNLTSGRNDLCLLYTSPSPRDATLSRMPSSA